MLKRFVGLAILLTLVLPLANAELLGSTTAVTATSATVTVGNVKSLTVVNDGANEVYVRVFESNDTTAAATTASRMIKSGEGFDFSSKKGIKAISLVCDTAETASVRLLYW